MIPGFEWPIIYDVRARPNVIQSTSGSRDLQMVLVFWNLPPLPARAPQHLRLPSATVADPDLHGRRSTLGSVC